MPGKRSKRQAAAAAVRELLLARMTAEEVEAFYSASGKQRSQMTIEEVKAVEAFKNAERKHRADQKAEVSFIKKRVGSATYLSSSPKEEDRH